MPKRIITTQADSDSLIEESLKENVGSTSTSNKS